MHLDQIIIHDGTLDCAYQSFVHAQQAEDDSSDN